jgi:ABC-type transport system involved in multi-copper enzyme maturation permease subunit
MSSVWEMALQTFRECARRRVFLLVPIATALFVALYAVGNHYAFRTLEGETQLGEQLVDSVSLAGATLVGLAMFVTLFLGSALGIFLTFGLVRGDAETGMLQPIVVRPVARWGFLLGRILGAWIVCGAYVLLLYLVSVFVTGVIGGWWPSPLVIPGLALVMAVGIVVALSTLGSIFLPALANGIAIFMVYGAGLLAGLLAQLGDALNSPGLENTGKIVSYILPFEALYQSGLNSLTSSATGLTRVLVQLGPLGGAQEGGLPLVGWSLVYLGGVTALAIQAFGRRDL